MKRYLPFILVVLVAAIAAGAGVFVYQKQMRAQAALAAAKPKFGKPGAEPPQLRGPKLAPITLEEFGDFECQPCAALWSALAVLEKEYGSRLRVIFREFPLAMHKHGMTAARAAEAAGLQGRFWEMYDQLYANRAAWTDAVPTPPPGSAPLAPGVIPIETFLVQYAQAIGVDVNRFKKDMESPEVSKRIAADQARASSLKVDRTPSVFVNEKEISVSAWDVNGVRRAIEATVNSKKPEEKNADTGRAGS